MTQVELFMKAINSLEGLDVSFKIGKESELVIKGDFIKMATAFGTIMQTQSVSNEAIRKVEELRKDIIKG